MTAPEPQQIPYSTAAGAAAHQKEVAARLGRLPPQQPVVRRPPALSPQQPVVRRPPTHQLAPMSPQADPYAEIGQMMVRLIGACLQTARAERPTVVEVRDALKHLASREAPHAAVDVGRVKEVVARHYGVTVAEIDSARCDAAIVLPRHVAITLTKRMTILDVFAIGRAFGGRDRSTISWAVRKIEGLAKTDSALAALLDDLTRDILAAAEVA